MLPKTTLVLGGAASGKSAFAEALVLADPSPRVYLATAQAFDDEMRKKIQIHTERRQQVWTTLEAPADTASALIGLNERQLCLLDCATMWLSNQMLAENDLETAQAELLKAIGRCPARLVIVSNEVGQGIVPDNALARRFRDAQGRLNIELAKIADTVVQVVAGLPNVLKGSIS